MYHAFLKAATPAEVHRDWVEQFPGGTTAVAEVPLAAALGRPLAREVAAPASLPGFRRSSVDGFAVRARDTFGAAEGNPIYLPLAGRVAMGAAPGEPLAPGTVVEVPTGGALPDGADGVVMLEYADLVGEATVEVRRGVAPLENVVLADADVARGEVLLARGRLLAPADLGFLAALGVARVAVHRPVRVAVLATGDEVRAPDAAAVPPGCVRNVNSPLLAAMLAAIGHETEDLGIVPDDPSRLGEALRAALAAGDVVALSGGSSAGAGDHTSAAIAALPEGRVDIHGIRMSPGKPTILGRAAGRPLIGLPGHPVSCAVVVDRFLKPLVRRLGGEVPWTRGPSLIVSVTENLESRPGREEYVRVKLAREGDGWTASPVRGPSGAVATLVRADGVVRIPLDREGLRAGEPAEFYDLGR